jgi:hypothetical protein
MPRRYGARQKEKYEYLSIENQRLARLLRRIDSLFGFGR